MPKSKDELYRAILGVLISVTLGLSGWALQKTVEAAERLSVVETNATNNDKAHDRIEKAIYRIEVKLDKLGDKSNE